MKLSSNFIAILGMLIALIGVYAVYVFVSWAFLLFARLDEKVAATLVAACTTIIASAVTVAYTQHKTKLREIENSHRPQKMEIYKRFMEEVVVGVLKSSKEKSFDDPEHRKKFEGIIFSFTGDIIVWGSPKVIQKYAAFRSGGKDPNIMLFMDDLLQAMRLDLGNSNHGLNRGDLIRLFINDPENLEKLLQKQS